MKIRIGRTGLKVISSVLLSAALLSAALLSAAWAAPKVTWSANKPLRGQLAQATVIGPYQIQPPKGYTLQSQPGPGDSMARAWVGVPRADGTRPYIMLGTITPPASEAGKYTLSQVSAKLLAGVQGRRKEWTQKPPERGTVNGITFVRTYWRGVDTVTGLTMHGFSYVAQDRSVFLQLSSQDVEPYHKTALALTEASALTFKKH